MITFLNNFEASAPNNVVQRAFLSLQEEMQSEKVGYYKLPRRSLEVLEDAKDIDTSRFSQIVVIGIGGSSLGIKAIDSMLRPVNKAAKEILFFENSDPLTILSQIQKIRPAEAAFFIISKSGSTIETTSIFKTLLHHFALDLDVKDNHRVFAITDNDSDLSKFALHHNLKAFYIPHNVGGRFSVLSAVGVVVLHFAGYDVKALLRGAANFIERFFEKKEKHLLEKAYFFYKNSKSLSINVLFSYADSLENFNKWYVQLWGESLGKIDVNGEHVGLTPIGIIGATDQHSFLQLIIEGQRDKTLTFIAVENFQDDIAIADITLEYIEKTNFVNGKNFSELINAQCKAVMQSVEEFGINTDFIKLDIINEENIGILIIYFELLTSLVGSMLKIDTYNQNGVECGKKILYSNLSKKV
jgi:glucose-6-phosphate isomerase